MVNHDWGDYSIDGGAAGCAGQNGAVQAAGRFGVRVEKLASLFPHRNFDFNFDYSDAYHLAH